MFEDSDQKIAAMIARLAELDERLVLEVGCGNGRITALLATDSTQLFAIEPNGFLIREARTRIARVPFTMARGENLPFPDSTFDLILFTLSLHHQSSGRALREAERVMKEDGAVLVVEPAEDGEVERCFSLLRDESMAKQQAQTAIEKSNFRVERAEIFSARWIFANEDELSRSLFDYYDLPYNPDTARQLSNMLGTKRQSRPLVLTDSIMIQSLKKRTPQ